MATYEGEKYIGEQIVSIIGQDYEDWILYIRDDGSADGTIDIIQSYIKQYPNKIVLLDNSSLGNNKGAKSNFNYLLQEVPDYSYYMFCDQDDVWKQNKISTLIAEMKKFFVFAQEPLLVFSDLQIVDEKLQNISYSFAKYTQLYLKKTNRLEQLLLYNVAPGCSMMFNDSLRQRIKEIPDNAIMHDWWFMIVAQIAGKILYVPDRLVLYRQHQNNTIGATASTTFSVKNKIKLLYIPLLKKRITFYQDYRKNILKQTQDIRRIYSKDIDKEQAKVIDSYISMLKKHWSVINVIWAFKNHFIFSSIQTTIKFWII